MVIVTRNRSASLRRTLDRLQAMPERPRIVVVDNASTDGTAEAVRSDDPGVDLLVMPENRGAEARNAGVHLVATPYVAFSDDDSWWAPGALSKAADLFESYPRLGLLAARILVGPDERLDPTCELMANSPLPTSPDLPGPAILGFLACGAIVRRSAFLESGGFPEHFGIGGEEELLAIDLAASGWGLSYVSELVAYHHPSPVRDPMARRRALVRNALWSLWMRRSAPSALRRTARVARSSFRDPAARAGLFAALGRLGPVLRARRVVPPALEGALRRLDG